MRQPPEEVNGAEIVKPAQDENLIVQTREYELITPLFGGGVEPGECDDLTPIRGTEIRGHLRFWWRATRGGNPSFEGKLEKMKDAEDRLWGAASAPHKPMPSQVQIQITVQECGGKFITRNHHGDEVPVHHLSTPYGYAAFSLREKPDAIVKEGIKFSMKISFPRGDAQEKEVAAALWAWETFGGLGARTRRGFGALKLVRIDGQLQTLPSPNPSEIKQFIEQEMNRHTTTGDWPPDVPCLPLQSSYLAITASHNGVRAAWEYLLTSLKEFRHDRPRNRVTDQRTGQQVTRPGRNAWPEPDEIRRLVPHTSTAHSTPRSNVRKFPRAAFGLPIIFEFKGAGEPRKTTLEGATDHQTRLASPLILRPLACARDKYVGLAVVLDTPRVPPGGVVLKGAPHSPIVNTELTSAEAKTIPRLNGDEDVLRAFLNYLLTRRNTTA